MKRGKSLRQAGDSRPGCWMVNTDCRYELSESMAALVSASLASLRLAVTERSTAGRGGGVTITVVRSRYVWEFF